MVETYCLVGIYINIPGNLFTAEIYSLLRLFSLKPSKESLIYYKFKLPLLYFAILEFTPCLLFRITILVFCTIFSYVFVWRISLHIYHHVVGRRVFAVSAQYGKRICQWFDRFIPPTAMFYSDKWFIITLSTQNPVRYKVRSIVSLLCMFDILFGIECCLLRLLLLIMNPRIEFRNVLVRIVFVIVIVCG